MPTTALIPRNRFRAAARVSGGMAGEWDVIVVGGGGAGLAAAAEAAAAAHA